MIEFADLTLLPDPTGALYVADYNVLLVADLHFEKGSSLARFGMIIPPYDTRSTLQQLEAAVMRYQPDTLIFLGDSFHDPKGPERLENADRARIETLAQQTGLIWISGNHDPLLGDDLPGDKADEISLGALELRHEPSLNSRNEICGHLHPAASITQRGRRLRRRCFAGNQERLFLPAFGAYTGGLNVTSAAFQPYWRNEDFYVWMVSKTGIHRFPSRKLL